MMPERQNEGIQAVAMGGKRKTARDGNRSKRQQMRCDAQIGGLGNQLAGMRVWVSKELGNAASLESSRKSWRLTRDRRATRLTASKAN